MPRRRAAATWVLRPGWEPLPGIGAGPLSDAEMRERWDAYRERNGWSADEAPLGGDLYVVAEQPDIAAAEGAPSASPDAAAALEDEEV